MELYITRPLPDRVIAHAQSRFNVTLRDQTTPLKKGEMRAALVLYDVIIPTLGDLFSADVFAGMQDARCRLLANFGVGYNHIDVAAARDTGIAVTNTPGAVTDATADIALMLMLMSARRAGEGERLVRSGKWSGWHPTQMLGLHLGGKTCGIIGMGRIGQAIARRAHFGLGMQVVYVNRSEKTLDFESRQLDSLSDLLGKSDIVVLAVPGGRKTRHLIGATELAQMQPHAHLINIARGDVVDEAALIAALRDGLIAGAGLDVYEFEPSVPDALRGMENVTLLPHLGTAALDVREGMGMMAVENAIAYLEGRAPPNAV
ncbi:MAG: D-glycerate dehydrogenase [Rhodobacteraceae bacterium]|nr:D-glycerate dehydrogenase [Paracoccaceae bacterium]